jgi:hypothetical protein
LRLVPDVLLEREGGLRELGVQLVETLLGADVDAVVAAVEERAVGVVLGLEHARLRLAALPGGAAERDRLEEVLLAGALSGASRAGRR